MNAPVPPWFEWPALPPHPLRLRRAEAEWVYPSHCAGETGAARLTLLDAENGSLVAVVTELNIGTSVTNAADEIWRELVEPDRPLVLLEHYLAGYGIGGEHIDQVHVPSGRPARWRRLWPTAPVHPERLEFDAWVVDLLPQLALVGAR